MITDFGQQGWDAGPEAEAAKRNAVTCCWDDRRGGTCIVPGTCKIMRRQELIWQKVSENSTDAEFRRETVLSATSDTLVHTQEVSVLECDTSTPSV